MGVIANMRTEVRPRRCKGQLTTCVEGSEKEQRKKNWVATEWSLHSFGCNQQPPVPRAALGRCRAEIPKAEREQPFTTDLRKFLYSCRRDHLFKAPGATALNAGREFTAAVPVW